jgi:hypothetical protein
LLFWSATSGQPLWAFAIRPSNVPPEDLLKLTYGVLPRLHGVQQVFPVEGEPRPLAPGEWFVIEVESRQGGGGVGQVPWVGRSYFYSEVQGDGSAKALGTPEYVETPQAVQELSRKMSRLGE